MSKYGPVEEELGTSVTSLSYDFKKHVGILKMPPLCCCDMSGCCALFQRIDPKVVEIRTFAGDKEDTVYRRANSKAEWHANR